MADAITATTTSEVPFAAASFLLFPISLCLKIFSRTTIEFATKIPTEVESPISDITFSEKPEKSKSKKVEIIENGIDSAAINVDLKSCKKNNNTRAVSRTPKAILVRVSSTEALINTDLSFTKSNFTPGGRV